jgi:hypothetical protein
VKVKVEGLLKKRVVIAIVVKIVMKKRRVIQVQVVQDLLHFHQVQKKVVVVKRSSERINKFTIKEVEEV